MTPQKVLLYKDKTTNKGLVSFCWVKRKKNKNLTIFYQIFLKLNVVNG